MSTSPAGKTRDWHAKYWKPVLSDGPSRALAMDLPESYFQPTASELQGAFAGMERKRANLVDAPMLTKALRDKETDSKSREKANRWPQVRSLRRTGHFRSRTDDEVDSHSDSVRGSFSAGRRVPVHRVARCDLRVHKVRSR